MKAWAKKGDIEFFMKEYHKALDSYRKVGMVSVVLRIVLGFGLQCKYSSRFILQYLVGIGYIARGCIICCCLGAAITFAMPLLLDCLFAFRPVDGSQGLTVEPNNSLCVDGVRKTSMKINEVGLCGLFLTESHGRL